MKESKFDVTDIVENFVKFRESVRCKALEDPKNNKEILTACDGIRSNMLACGIQIKVHIYNCDI